jgi:sulfate transport system permease protein
MLGKWSLRVLAIGYLGALLICPVAMIAYRTFAHGVSPVWSAVTNPSAVSALELTLEVTAIAVPINTVLGVLLALAMVRSKMPGKALIGAILDLPFAVSPVVVGLMLILVYGQTGWFGAWFVDNGTPIIFAVPGIVIATTFASLPFVAREVIPVLNEIGTEQEQAAATLGAGRIQTFVRITLPSIRWGLIYGVVLTTARAIGEYGAVAVVSGNVIGQTQTLTLYADQSYQNFDTQAAYAAGLELAMIALVTLFVMNLIKPRRER